MKLKRNWAFSFVAVCLLVTSLWAAEIPSVRPETVGMSPARLEAMQARAEKMVTDKKVAGVITLVARKGKIAHFEACGYRDIEADEPMELDTIVRIFSMTKPIASVAVMILVEQGQVQLDEPVETYIPELAGLKVYAENDQDQPEPVETKRKVTVRDLLRHTSGLTYGIFGDTPVDKMYRQKNILGNRDIDEMVDRLAEIPLLHQPGTKWHYSVSTDVLGCLVERVSGQNLDAFFRENIFEPLDMKDTGFYVPPEKQDRFSQCYSPKPDGGGLAPTSYLGAEGYLRPPTFLSGGGGLVSTARDYLRFSQMLLNQGQLDSVRILEAETVEMMSRDQLPSGVSSGKGAGFGLGFSVQRQVDRTGLMRVGEYGWGGAASTFFGISPNDRTVIVILTQYMPYSDKVARVLKPMIYEAILD